MERKIYFTLLVIVIAGVVVLGAGVPKSHTVRDRIQSVPEAWRGTWEVTVAYRDRDTGALVATDVTTAEICPGEPIIPPQLRAQVLCSDQIADSDIGVSCRNRQMGIRDRGCDFSAAAELATQRNGESWSGTGSWSVNFVGNCSQTTQAEDFVVSGTRISTEAACDAEPSSLLEKFFAHSNLVPALEGSN